MQKLTRFIPPLLWVGAAAFVFPTFTPNSYNAFLFGGRLAAAVVCLALAFIAFRTPNWLKANVVAGVIALGAANYVASAGYDLIPPNEAHLRALIDEGLAAQGAEAAAAYSDLRISGMKCRDDYHSWDCDVGLSYKVVSTNEVRENDLQNIQFDKATGKRRAMVTAHGCFLDFQWSRRLRASSYYKPDMEPLKWNGCEGSEDGTSFVNSLVVKGGYGLTLKLPKDNFSARLMLEPLPLRRADNVVKDAYGEGLDNIACDYATSDPNEIRCAVSGTKTVWEGNVASISDPLGTSTTQLKGSFRETVRIVPEGGQWVVKP